MINFLSEHFIYFLFVTFFFGLAVGSFLNVVIYRLPVMLQAEWRKECCELLALENKSANKADKKISLAWPCSYCPHCRQSLRSWHNIPLLSFLFLKGKCAYCRQAIHWRYPLVELITGLLFVLIAAHWGVAWPTLAAMIFTGCLLALLFIDFEYQLLPDDITLPLVWLGLLVNMFGWFTDLQAAVIGAMAGYLALWLVAKLFTAITGKIGMGHGDFKLLAVIGAWSGWQILPLVILLASFAGAVVGISLIVFKKHGRHIPIAFGPYLAMAGWLGLVFNQALMHIYSGLL